MAQIADSLSRAHNDVRRSVVTIVNNTQDTQSTTRRARAERASESHHFLDAPVDDQAMIGTT
ncbi:hypothetical protein, partial [Pseudomonas viridiflava]|uniref:hypothetical protein n=1 Tax=Pseudomonas viridiflava TaxID=33069 RepID=UPI001C2DBA4B